MYFKKIKIILLIFLLYQSPIHSKSNSFSGEKFTGLSKYFSGIVASENKNNSDALNFFSLSKILIDKHDPYLKRYIYSLVLENKIPQAINLIKMNKEKNNSNFFEAHLLLVVDDLKKSEFKSAYTRLNRLENISEENRLNLAIFEILKQYVYVFKENKILDNKKNFGKLSIISETFQRCYLGDKKTDLYFSNLFNDPQTDYSRYKFFYLSYLIENGRMVEAKKITDDIEFINSTLLLSQGKSWIESGNAKKFRQVFSCKNHQDITSEFLFIISNLYSSQDNFEKSNFYLNVSNFLNQKFLFNLSLTVENQLLNGEYKEARKTLKNFKKSDDFYFWFRVKKEAQIIAKQKNKEESLNYLNSQFNKISQPNKKFLYDMGNFYKNAKKYNQAIEYYSKVIEKLDKNSEIKSNLLYRRGSSFERLRIYDKADKDLKLSLKIKPDDAYVLNYLAYSWLERDYKINDAIKMLETAYAIKSDDPYIIDSIGWAYYLINDFLKAEEFLKRAVELMPDDPIVNDHYGDILWKLDRKIQARYFWSSVLNMNDADDEMISKINVKLVKGLKNL
tara:strand:- start:898 stop:2583 length:1686 start_codon:yes stop_codon:yes gene_type:complete